MAAWPSCPCRVGPGRPGRCGKSPGRGRARTGGWAHRRAREPARRPPAREAPPRVRRSPSSSGSWPPDARPASGGPAPSTKRPGSGATGTGWGETPSAVGGRPLSTARVAEIALRAVSTLSGEARPGRPSRKRSSATRRSSRSYAMGVGKSRRGRTRRSVDEGADVVDHRPGRARTPEASHRLADPVHLLPRSPLARHR